MHLGGTIRDLGTTDAILPFAKEYMDIVLIGAVFQTYVFAVNNAVRAEGNARVAMLTMVIGALANIGLDALFILKLGMGIRGAATATVIAQVISTVYVTSYYLTGKSTLKISVKNFALKVNIMRGVLALGLIGFIMGIL